MNWSCFDGFRGMLAVPMMMPAMLLAITGFAVVAWLVVRRASPETDGSTKALDILRERFARGEIDRQEFEARHEGLTR